MTKKDERQPTTEKLAQALIDAKAPQEMIERARSGYYDDYKSSIGDNIRALVEDARKNNLPDIAERAIGGEFDAQKWESDEWAKEPEGRATFAEFGHLLP